MAVIPDYYTVFPASSVADQKLLEGAAGYRYRIVDWYFGSSAGTGQLALYFGSVASSGRFVSAGLIGVAGGVGWSPRMLAPAPISTDMGIALAILPFGELLLGYEGESIGLYSSSAGITFSVNSFLTYQKIAVNPSGI